MPARIPSVIASWTPISERPTVVIAAISAMDRNGRRATSAMSGRFPRRQRAGADAVRAAASASRRPGKSPVRGKIKPEGPTRAAWHALGWRIDRQLWHPGRMRVRLLKIRAVRRSFRSAVLRGTRNLTALMTIAISLLACRNHSRFRGPLGLQHAFYHQAPRQNEECECQGDDGYLEIPAAGGHSHHRAGPDTGSGCNPLCATLGMQNGPCPDEANPSDNALHDTRRILVHLQADDHDRGCAESHQHVRSQPRRLVP